MVDPAVDVIEPAGDPTGPEGATIAREVVRSACPRIRLASLATPRSGSQDESSAPDTLPLSTARCRRPKTSVTGVRYEPS